MVGSKCRDFKNREVSNVNAPTVERCVLTGTGAWHMPDVIIGCQRAVSLETGLKGEDCEDPDFLSGSLFPQSIFTFFGPECLLHS